MENSQDGGKKKNTNKQTTTIIVAVVIILAALILARAIQDEAPTENVATSEQETTEDSEEAMMEESPAELQASFLTQDEFTDLREARFVINSTQGKPTSGTGSEEIQAGIVVDEADEETHYFATSSYNAREEENFVGIYRYNSSSNRWWRMYKTTLETEDEETPMLRVLGKQGDHLILAWDTLEREAEACESLWLLDDLVRLDMNDAYGGFEEYSLPDDLRLEEEMKQSECLASDDE